MNILHVITGLNNGGAENVLLRLIMNDSENKHFVVSLTGTGDLEPLFVKHATVYLFNLKKGVRRFVRDFRGLHLPEINLIQGWMYHGNLFATLLSIYFKCSHCWNIRHSNVSLFGESLSTLIAFFLSIIFSAVFKPYIIYCATRSHVEHRKFFRSRNSFIIENGFDSGSALERDSVQPLNRCVEFVFVGRNVKQKNISKILAAFGDVRNDIENFRLHIYGAGFDTVDIESIVKKYDLGSCVIIYGPEARKERIYLNKHFLVLCSDFGEGFPNVVLEAMAFGIPSIVSDCGDCFNIIGNSGFKVHNNTPKGISRELLRAAQTSSSEYAKLSTLAQHRASQEFSVGKMITKYNHAWREIDDVK